MIGAVAEKGSIFQHHGKYTQRAPGPARVTPEKESDRLPWISPLLLVNFKRLDIDHGRA